MENMVDSVSDMRIGFFPCFFSMGETLPHIKIAELFRNRGYDIVFFSHDGKFEHLAGSFELIQLSPLSWVEARKEREQKNFDPLKNYSMERLMFYPYLVTNNEEYVSEEIQAFKDANIDILICSFNPTVSISARAAQIPLFMLQSGTATIPFMKTGGVSFPENYESMLTSILPQKLKNLIARWFLLHNKLLVKDFNNIARKYSTPSFQTLHDILKGDFNLVCDDIHFLGIEPTEDYPLDRFIGPIFGGLSEATSELDEDIKNHLNNEKKSIFVTLGSTLDDELFISIVNTLNTTDYNVIILDPFHEKRDLSDIHENILFKSFINSPQRLHERVDLSIIHGGRGTVYTVAYSGKPAIGVPHYMEHQYNLDNLVSHGMAIRLSKRNYRPEKLVDAINYIFNNYDYHLQNAQRLSTQLTPIAGEQNAVEVIKKIYDQEIKKL